MELKSPRLSPPCMHNILTEPATTHLGVRGIPRNLSVISEKSSSSLSGEVAEVSDETPLATPRESTVYIDVEDKRGETRNDDESLSMINEDASPPPASLRNKRKLSISLPDIANLAETAGLLFLSTPTQEDVADGSFDSESEGHGSGDSETSSALLAAPSETSTPSVSPLPLQPAIAQTMSLLLEVAPHTAAKGRGALSSSSFSSPSRPHDFEGKEGPVSLPSSPHPYQTRSWHPGLQPSPSPNGLDFKTDKRRNDKERRKEEEGRKEVEGSVTKRPSFKHQTSHDAPNMLKKHKKHSTFNFKG